MKAEKENSGCTVSLTHTLSLYSDPINFTLENPIFLPPFRPCTAEISTLFQTKL